MWGSGEINRGNACDKLYVHLRAIRAIHTNRTARRGIITKNGNARVNDWKARNCDRDDYDPTAILTSLIREALRRGTRVALSEKFFIKGRPVITFKI